MVKKELSNTPENIRSRRYYHNNLEKSRERARIAQKKYYAENREKILEKLKIKNATNPEFREKKRLYDKKRKQNPEYKKQVAEWNRRYRNKPVSFCKKMVAEAKKRAELKNMDFDIDYKFLLKKLNRGVCELSGIPFAGFSAEEYAHNVRPYYPSLDRIDSNKGYTKRNTRLVLVAVNIALNQWGDSVLLHIAENLIKQHKRKLKDKKK